MCKVGNNSHLIWKNGTIKVSQKWIVIGNYIAHYWAKDLERYRETETQRHRQIEWKVRKEEGNKKERQTTKTERKIELEVRKNERKKERRKERKKERKKHRTRTERKMELEVRKKEWQNEKRKKEKKIKR